MPNTINGEAVKTSPAAAPSLPILPKDFDGKAYLRANRDVRAAKMDPAKHWLEYGHKEGRPLR